MKHILGFIGPSGAGKSTLIDALFQHFPERFVAIPSLTTRPRRGSEDDRFFHFTTKNKIDELEKTGHLIQRSEYAGNSYANEREAVDAVLQDRIGVMAIVEQGVLNFRKAGYQVDLIRIIPQNYQITENMARQQADLERARLALPAALEIKNSFLPGGKEQTIKTLCTYVQDIILRDANNIKSTLVKRIIDKSEKTG